MQDVAIICHLWYNYKNCYDLSDICFDSIIAVREQYCQVKKIRSDLFSENWLQNWLFSAFF